MPSAKAIWTAFLAGLDPELRAEFAADDTWAVPMVEGVLQAKEKAEAAAAVVADQELITGHFPGYQQIYRTVLEVTGIDPDNERVAAVSAPGRVTLFPDYWGQIPLPVREAIQRSYGPVDLRESIDRLPLSDIWAGDTFEVSGALLVTVPNAPLAIAWPPSWNPAYRSGFLISSCLSRIVLTWRFSSSELA